MLLPSKESMLVVANVAKAFIYYSKRTIWRIWEGRGSVCWWSFHFIVGWSNYFLGRCRWAEVHKDGARNNETDIVVTQFQFSKWISPKFSATSSLGPHRRRTAARQNCLHRELVRTVYYIPKCTKLPVKEAYYTGLCTNTSLPSGSKGAGEQGHDERGREKGHHRRREGEVNGKKWKGKFGLLLLRVPSRRSKVSRWHQDNDGTTSVDRGTKLE